MTHIMSYEFHPCDSFEQMTCFKGFDWLMEVMKLTQKSQLIDFRL